MTVTDCTGERGFTVVELTVALALLSIVSVIVFGFLVSVLKTTTTAANNTRVEQAIDLALRSVTEDIRGASILATTYPSATTSCAAGSYPSGYENCLSFTILRPQYGELTCAKSVVTYGLKTDGVLREDRTDYRVSSGTCVPYQLYTGRPIVSGIVNSTMPLFTFFDRFGNELDPDAAGQTTAPFTAVETVRVSVAVRYAKNAPLLSYTSDLALRNNR
jgi:prepilin-type N-terminal cleavage/methylation domain-containing protein